MDDVPGGRRADFSPDPPDSTLPATTIVVPTLNEAGKIGSVLASLLSSDEGFVLELIVADGGSTDGTRELVEEAGRRDPRIRLVHNPARLQSAGVNRAADLADPRAEVILRADAHAGYPADFAERAVRGLVESGADSLVVRMHTVGHPCFQRAVAAVSNSAVGTGGSAHRSGSASGFVDHGHHAAFQRAVFRDLGGYDESFATNEDAEFDTRIGAAGGRVWLQGDLVLDYYPRRTPGRSRPAILALRVRANADLPQAQAAAAATPDAAALGGARHRGLATRGAVRAVAACRSGALPRGPRRCRVFDGASGA